MANTTINTPIILECKDTSEKIDLSETLGIYIKPIARLNITIQLPPNKLAGQIASPAEIMEKLKKQSQPEELISIKIIKNTLDFMRFEAEIENKSSIKNLLQKLDGATIKLSNYTDLIRVRAAEAKIVYPTRHDWDTFYGNVQNVNDLKPGERPDTVHIQDVPCKWFAEKKVDPDRPSETILKTVFSLFGEIRCMDIPLLERLNSKYTFDKVDSANFFNAFIQYKDYISFVKAMDTFRGMKLLYIDRETQNAFTSNIKIDFDRARHLSDKEIQKRSIERLKAIEVEKIKFAQLEKEKEKAAKIRELANYKLLLHENDQSANDKQIDSKSKEDRRREREEIRRNKRLAKKQMEEEKKLAMKIAVEERKILIAQRKLESMRLLEELFNRVKGIIVQEELKKRENLITENSSQKLELEESNIKIDEKTQSNEQNNCKINEEQFDKLDTNVEDGQKKNENILKEDDDNTEIFSSPKKPVNETTENQEQNLKENESNKLDADNNHEKSNLNKKSKGFKLKRPGITKNKELDQDSVKLSKTDSNKSCDSPLL